MRTWLFDVHDLMPIKSTNQKAKGLPSMAWEKVLDLPPERQRIYTPAVDKQTMQILSEEFDTLDELLNLNAVGNVCKAFLKKAEVYADELTGETVTEENGIRAWVSSDLRLRCNFSTTETSRSRTWAPNILNYPSYVNDRIKLTIIRVVQEAHEEGALPEELLKWVGEENIPSVRSCFKALDGQLLVESDLKTAEMFALGYISGDRDLLRILEEPDPEWAVLKPGRCGPYTRVCYSSTEMTGIPFAKQNQDYIMSVWKNGEFVGKVTEDDLERNPDGSVKHRSYDIHWSVVERTYERPREEMVEKIHRNAGKVLNFCVAGDALVETRDRGAVAMKSITLDDWLWDGVEWVQHEGVIYTGRKEVVFYQGLWATKEHEVWTVEQGKVHLGEAIEQSLQLERSSPPCGEHPRNRTAGVPADGGAEGIGILLRADSLRDMPGGTLEGASEPGERVFLEVPVPGREEAEQRSPGRRLSGVEAFSRALGRHEAAVRDRSAPALLPLLRAWHKAVVFVQETLHRLGTCNLAWAGVHGTRVRSKGQRWALLPGELEAVDAEGKHGEPRVDVFERGYRSCASTSSADARDRLHGGRGAGLPSLREDTRGNTGAVDEEPTRRFTETYDILNAGPRHRFTCSGVLVSNSSAYGASAGSLERKIESDTGTKPEPGTGQKGLDAIAARQPRATQFLEEMAEIPARGGYYRAASGRIRHCVVHGDNVEVGWRTRQSIESALGREFRNFP
jgi:hypothetical protein